MQCLEREYSFIKIFKEMKTNLEPGKMAWQFGVQRTLVQFPAIHGEPQKSVMPVQGDLIPSSGLYARIINY